MSNEAQHPNTPAPSSNDHTSGATATVPPAPTGQPAQAPIQRRTSGVTIFFGVMTVMLTGLLLLVAIPVMVAAALIAGIASGEIEVNSDKVVVDVTPATIEEIPASIVEDNGDVEIDLTNLDAADFDTAVGPVPLDVSLDVGSIKIIVPDDLDVSVDASVDVGEVIVFDDSESGIVNETTRSDDNADLELDLDVDAGRIEVVRD